MTLDQLGLKHKTDKASNHHNYLGIYEEWMTKYKSQNINLYDSTGGYFYPEKGGESLRMWAEWCSNWKIVGTDLYEKTIKVPKNVVLHQCDQTDVVKIKEIFEKEGNPTIYIEDHSHVPSLSVKTFEIVFPFLESGGLYCYEDCEGSWFNTHGFDGTTDYNDMNFAHAVNYFRRLVNAVNGPRYIGNFVPNELEKMVKSIHFFPNFVFIIKR